MSAQPGELTFDVEFVLTKAHPAYAPAPPSERECFRRGTLRLVSVERLADASHWVHHDEAERVNQLLIDFFASAP